MKKLMVSLLFVLMIFSASQAFAALDETRPAINAKYGEFRLVVDTDSQLWTKAEWEAGGYKKAKPAAFVHRFVRKDITVQMEVQYDDNKPGSLVSVQRFTPDSAIKVKELKEYFPEIHSMVTSADAAAFTSFMEVSRNLRDNQSPVTMGVVLKQNPVPAKKSYYTLLVFNIRGEGSLIKDEKQINADTYIHEIIIEKILKQDADPDRSGSDWKWLKNPF
jgi:hypothetical protein